MARFRFQTDTHYAAKLRFVHERPIENHPTRGSLHLLRLEFEVFRIMEARNWLRALGALASRDIIIGDFLDASKDSGLARYCEVLQLKPSRNLEDWKALEGTDTWIKIQFGSLDIEDTGRNPFHMIATFDPTGYVRKPMQFDVAAQWVRVAHAAEYLETSDQTIRRRADKWQQNGYPDIQRRTQGGHREINLPLLWDLWDEERKKKK
ncbi:MAG TPA: hypothetical protein DCY79_19950 [Planctomycetaceae bacterium]|nr:hypothetical protein [Blastopirellula sp.]HAY82085.1 hypothetical protein [Planctomycetaceae bacterium]